MGVIEQVAGRLRAGAPEEQRRPMQAVWNGVVLAESDCTVEVEGNQYFPADSLNREHFVESEKRTICPWKGRASYYTIEAGGERNQSAAWTYRNPSPLARKIKDHVAFADDIEVRATG